MGWPLVADARSGQRLGNDSPLHLAHLDRFLERPGESVAVAFAPRGIVQIGGRLTAKRLVQWLSAASPCL